VAKSYQNHLDVAASKYNIASLKETQGDLEGARRLFLECEQIYAKVLGVDHEETLDAAMRALTVGKEEEDEEGEEEDSTEVGPPERDKTDARRSRMMVLGETPLRRPNGIY
jgi:hypothetical protein